MRVLSFYRSKAPASAPPTPEHMTKMGAFMEEMIAKGHLVAAGGFIGEEPGLRAELSHGAFDISEIANPTEGFGGFGYLQAASRAEMEAVVKRFLEVAGDGECIVWPCMEGPPPPAE